jgi:stage III sporulation protein AG
MGKPSFWLRILPPPLRERLMRMGLKETQIETLLRLILLGMLGLALLRYPGSGAARAPADAPPPPAGAERAANPEAAGLRDEERALEGELESLLSMVRGAGRVRVSVVLEATSERRFGKNVSEDVQRTEETDPDGGTRTVELVSRTEEIVLARQGGQDQAVLATLMRPRVTGAVVVVEGGADPRVRTEISRALQALLGLAPHKIQILTMRR